MIAESFGTPEEGVTYLLGDARVQSNGSGGGAENGGRIRIHPQLLLRASGLQPKKGMGQHFLSSGSIAEQIVRSARIEPEDTVVEIGAGLGALTLAIAQRARKVVAVEKDKEIFALLSRQIQGAGAVNILLVHGDILRFDFAALASSEHRPLVVLGNLPYNISSQVLARLVHLRSCLSRAILMFQTELARRIIAGPGGRDYGRLSVLVQYASRVRPLLKVAPCHFYPRPQVESEVLEVVFHKAPAFQARDEKMLFSLVKAAFGKRRKTLRNALGDWSLSGESTCVAKVLERTGIDPMRRAETLTVEEFVKLSDAWI